MAKKDSQNKVNALGKLQDRKTFPMGGVTQKDLKKLGRNMARIKNQKTGA